VSVFFGRNRVEEDLARIRHANLPDKYPDPHAGKGSRPRRKKASDSQAIERFGAKDTLAMIIAVFSLALPYAVAFIGVMGLIVFLIARFW
jgi:hypothetical protein